MIDFLMSEMTEEYKEMLSEVIVPDDYVPQVAPTDEETLEYSRYYQSN